MDNLPGPTRKSRRGTGSLHCWTTRNPEYPAEDMPLEIRYEDRDLLVVDKPPGMLIHPSRHRMTGTLANGVLGYYRRTGQACAFHPATRLDRDTFWSGAPG